MSRAENYPLKPAEICLEQQGFIVKDFFEYLESNGDKDIKMLTSFMKNYAKLKNRLALKRSPVKNDGGDCEKSPWLKNFMQ
jgi:hypothetical protein